MAVCAFVAGLTHDLGKPLSDLRKAIDPVSRYGIHMRLPWSIGCIPTILTDTFIGWNGTEISATKLLLLLLPKILTDEVSAYLNKTGPQVFNALLESLMGTSAIGTLTSLVVEADQASVTRGSKQTPL